MPSPFGQAEETASLHVLPPLERNLVRISILLLILNVVAFTVYALLEQQLIQAVYDGNIPGLAVSHDRPVTIWRYRAKAVLQRAALVTFGIPLLAIAFAYRRRARLLRDYFNGAGSPYDLAITRWLVFGVILYLIYILKPMTFCGLSPELTIPPIPWTAVFTHTSFPVAFTQICLAALIVCCICGIVGFYTRTCSALACLLSLYVLGIPESFGKVNHYHYVVWFTAILAVSPAGDALSIDAIRSARRYASEGKVRLANASNQYALPMRFIWLLMAFIYFFPGYYKLLGGTYGHIGEWANSDSLRNSLYISWYVKGFTPIARLDKLPNLCHVLAWSTIVFEMSWPFVLFFPKLRPLLALATITFHSGTYLFMGISFFPLRIMMLALLPWHSWLSWLGRKIYGKRVHLSYDASDKTAVLAVNILNCMNPSDRFEYAEVSDPQAGAVTSATPRISLTTDTKILTGPAAVQEVFRQAPLARAAMALVRLSAPRLVDGRPSQVEPSISSRRQVIAMGLTLLALNGVAAVLHSSRSWPFTVFPTFEVVYDDAKITTINFELLTRDGTRYQLDQSRVKKVIPSETWGEMLYAILHVDQPALQKKKCEAITQMLIDRGLIDPQRFEKVTLYQVQVDATPGHEHEIVVDKRLHEVQLRALKPGQLHKDA